MKLALTLFITLFSLLMLQACHTSQGTREVSSTTGPERLEMGDSAEVELADYLRRVSGVTVSGSGANTQVRIRGESSILGTNEPLFVVDGRVMGQSYSSVSFLNAWDIANVNVLKGSEAASYGSRGANGVIEIEMKK